MDISNALKEILEYYKASAGEQWEDVKEQAMEYLRQSEERWLLVASEIAVGDLDAEFLTQRAKDEIGILESQALSFGIISASFTQEVVNTTLQNLLITVIQFLTKVINK